MAKSRIEPLKVSVTSSLEKFIEEVTPLLIDQEKQELSDILSDIKEAKTANEYLNVLNCLNDLCINQMKEIEARFAPKKEEHLHQLQEHRHQLQEHGHKFHEEKVSTKGFEHVETEIKSEISSLKGSIKAAKTLLQIVPSLTKELDIIAIGEKLLETDFPLLQARLKEALKNSTSGFNTVKIQAISTEMDMILKKSEEMHPQSLEKAYQELCIKLAQVEKKPSLLSKLFGERTASPNKNANEPARTVSPRRQNGNHS